MQASYGEKCVRDASKLKVLYKTVLARCLSTFAEDLGGRSPTPKTVARHTCDKPGETVWEPATNERGNSRKTAANSENQFWETGDTTDSNF